MSKSLVDRDGEEWENSIMKLPREFNHTKKTMDFHGYVMAEIDFWQLKKGLTYVVEGLVRRFGDGGHEVLENACEAFYGRNSQELAIQYMINLESRYEDKYRKAKRVTRKKPTRRHKKELE